MTTPYELRPPNEPRRPQEPTHGRRFAVSVTLLYAITVLSLAALLGLRMHDWARQRIVQSSILATIGTPIVSAADAVATEMAAPDLSGSAASQPQAAAPVVTPEPTPSFINILLLGSDERPDETGPSRTDTMILLSINPQEKTLGMLSMPRDLWVPIPGQNITTKINTAYGIGEAQAYAGGGAQLAKDTVSSLIGRPVDYFVRVNFDGFRELIDLIGGVDVVVASTIHDEEYPTADYGVETFHLDAGPQHLDGATALKYARTRHTDDDYNRARRQQEIIRAVADKVLSANMIPQLLPRVPQLLMTMQNSIETDIPIPVGLDLANLVSGSTLREVRQLVLDSQYGEETYSSEGAWILLPDRARVRVALDRFFGTASGAGTAAASADALRIEVLNGTMQPGIAASTAQKLEGQGWRVVSIDDADRKDYQQTIIINYAAPSALVQKLSSDLGLNAAEATFSGLDRTSPIDIRIVVGQDLLGR
jgi:LCP family protein required for cell wall assembly